MARAGVVLRSERGRSSGSQGCGRERRREAAFAAAAAGIAAGQPFGGAVAGIIGASIHPDPV